MANYESIEYYLIIPKIIEISMFWFMAYKIRKDKRSTLSNVFAIAFITWTFYTMADMIMWITAANSETWLLIDNIIRDVQVSSAVVFSYLIFLATEIIIHGSKGLNKRKLIIVGIVSFCVIIGLIIVDRIDVYDVNNELLSVSNWDSAEVVVIAPNISPWTVGFMTFPFIIYLYSIITLIHLIRSNIKESELKRKMYFLIIGIVLIPLGILYFTFVLGIDGFYNFWTATFGRLCWMFAPIFIWLSQQKSTDHSQNK